MLFCLVFLFFYFFCSPHVVFLQSLSSPALHLVSVQSRMKFTQWSLNYITFSYAHMFNRTARIQVHWFAASNQRYTYIIYVFNKSNTFMGFSSGKLITWWNYPWQSLNSSHWKNRRGKKHTPRNPKNPTKATRIGMKTLQCTKMEILKLNKHNYRNSIDERKLMLMNIHELFPSPLTECMSLEHLSLWCRDENDSKCTDLLWYIEKKLSHPMTWFVVLLYFLGLKPWLGIPISFKRSTDTHDGFFRVHEEGGMN